ncbi:hypothetical protein TorRG33x02_169550 [Trema orientale]|uniref:Uncharacterized protein n=1 Tax=Trema orientale TaxID=63057 RepID=A0A2P5EP83_TREOI|nr:hypothetical protein TorRG33x02_169550 [Trema orientale]
MFQEYPSTLGPRISGKKIEPVKERSLGLPSPATARLQTCSTDGTSSANSTG